MSQLEDNLTFRLGQLEKTLEAYRALHDAELAEIARALAELRPEVEALVQSDWLTPRRPMPDTLRSTTTTADDTCRVCREWTSENELTC